MEKPPLPTVDKASHWALFNVGGVGLHSILVTGHEEITRLAL